MAITSWPAPRLRAPRRLLAFALTGIVTLASCADFLPSTVTVSRAKIDEALTRRFPYHGTLLGVFTVDVRLPRLRFLADADRLGADFDVTLAERLGGRVYHGALTIDGALRYEPGDHSVRLADARLRSFSVDGLPADTQALVNNYGALLAAQAVGDLTLYTLTPADVQRLDTFGVRPGAIHVTRDGLRIAVEDAPPK